jgi:nitroreductase
MEFTTTVRRRRMVRSYDADRPVARSTVAALLDLAIRAPSAGFSQGWRFLVLDEASARDRFWAATSDGGEPDRWLRGMRTAPVLILTLADKQAYLDRYAEPDKGWSDRDENRWPVPYWLVDAGMASLLILLGSVDAGLGSCFFGVPGESLPQLRAAFGIPERLTPVGVISIGYPAADRRSPSLGRGRREIDEVTSYNQYQE